MSSKLLDERRELRRKGGELARQIAEQQAVIDDESVEGSPLEAALLSKDELMARDAERRTRLGEVEAEIRRHESVQPAAGGFGFSEEVGEDGLAIDSIQRLTW